MVLRTLHRERMSPSFSAPGGPEYLQGRIKELIDTRSPPRKYDIPRVLAPVRNSPRCCEHRENRHAGNPEHSLRNQKNPTNNYHVKHHVRQVKPRCCARAEQCMQSKYPSVMTGRWPRESPTYTKTLVVKILCKWCKFRNCHRQILSKRGAVRDGGGEDEGGNQ
jgi:hypothetical protein